ncbi:ATP-grasp domain-containing protein [Patescibacteria group bacterium]|nr:ATP-grasp domain-containing protein [Patescibacteria group bacterium]MBU1885598.1 ATP-grasp domain-containing protein [Patescibacteria group bacterium]
MKKILFIYHQFEDYFNYFIAEAKNLKVKLDFTNYQEISLNFSNQEINIFANSISLKEYDLIYFRNAWRNSELSILISLYAKNNHIPVVDPVFTAGFLWIDRKSFEYLTLQKNNLPIIPSIFISNQQINLTDKMSFPLVGKYTDSSRGMGVFLVENKKELSELFNQSDKSHLLLQAYIKNSGDYRLFVIGDEVIGAMKRAKRNKKEIKNHILLSKESKAYIPSEEEKRIAIRATQVLNYSFAGVDLIKDENGKISILEVNRSPHFTRVMSTNKINIPRKMIRYLISASN